MQFDHRRLMDDTLMGEMAAETRFCWKQMECIMT